MSDELLGRLKLDLKNNFNEKYLELDTKGNTKTNHSVQPIYESDVLDLNGEEKLVVDASGQNGRSGKRGADGKHVLVQIKLLEHTNTLRVYVFMDSSEEVYELENFSSRKPHILITTMGGNGSNGFPVSQPFGDSLDHCSEPIMGKDGGDGGNITIVIEESIKYLLDERYLKVCHEGGNGGEPYIPTEQSFDNFDVNSIILPPEAPLSTITSQSSVLTFSKLSFIEPPSYGRQFSSKSTSTWKGINGRKGRSGVIKYIIVSPQSGEVLEQASSTFNLKVTSFNIKIIANPLKEKSIGHNVLDDNTLELDLIDPTEFIEPGCELAIIDIEIKNLGGLSSPEKCFIEFEGNDFVSVLGFSSYLEINLQKPNIHNLPILSGGECLKLPLPLRLVVGKQARKLEKATNQSCNLNYFIRKHDELNTLILSQGQLCDMPIYYPISLSSFDCPSTLGIFNDCQKICVSIENKTDHLIRGATVRVCITGKDLDTDSERIFTENIFSIEDSDSKIDRLSPQLDRVDQELSVIESIVSLPSVNENKLEQKDLSISLEKEVRDRVTACSLNIQICKHKKINEETLGFRKFNLLVQLEYKGILIETIVRTIILIPDKIISQNAIYHNPGKALLVTDSCHLTYRAYTYYKRLFRSIGFELYVWDFRHSDTHREKFTFFKDSLILVTVFTTCPPDFPSFDSIISHFNNSSVVPNDSGLMYVTGYPYSLDSLDFRNQLFEKNAKHYPKNFHIVDAKHLSIFFPLEKPSKSVFLEKVNNYLKKKRDNSPSLLMRIHKKDFYEDLKCRLPRKLKIGEASINILPIKLKDRIFCVKFASSKTPSNNIPEFSPDILTDYHRFSFNSKTFALIFGIVMSSSIQHRVTLLLNRFTEKEWQFCDQKTLKVESSNTITLRDLSLFSIYFEIIQELFLKENSLHRFKLLVRNISDCFINSPTITADKEQLLQYVKILLDKLRTESTKIPTQDKAIALKKKDFLKLYTQLRKILIEKCRLVINNNKKKSTSSKRMYKMLGGEGLQVKKNQFDDNCRFLLQFILKPASGCEGSIFRFQKYKWSFERLLLDSEVEETESQTLPLLF